MNLLKTCLSWPTISENGEVSIGVTSRVEATRQRIALKTARRCEHIRGTTRGNFVDTRPTCTHIDCHKKADATVSGNHYCAYHALRKQLEERGA